METAIYKSEIDEHEQSLFYSNVREFCTVRANPLRTESATSTVHKGDSGKLLVIFSKGKCETAITAHSKVERDRHGALRDAPLNLAA